MKILNNINLGKKTTIGVGGNAKFFCEAKREGDLINAKNFAKKNNLGIIFFGIGSNLFFSKNIENKLVCRIKNNFFEKIGEKIGEKFIFEKNFEKNFKKKSPDLEKKFLNFNKNFLQKNGENFGIFQVGAGTILGNLINILIKENFDLTPLSGFPSTIGGAIVGNAGLCGFEMKDFLISAKILNSETGKIENWENKDFKFGYRTSKIKNFIKKNNGKNNFIISDCILKIPKFSGKNENLKEKLQKNLKERAEKQPKGRSAGSFFKNPEGDFAGRLIEEVGLKGKKIGGAYFSGKHANFLMTKEGVKIEDVLKLKNLAKKLVKEKFGIELEEEIVIY